MDTQQERTDVNSTLEEQPEGRNFVHDVINGRNDSEVPLDMSVKRNFAAVDDRTDEAMSCDNTETALGAGKNGDIVIYNVILYEFVTRKKLFSIYFEFAFLLRNLAKQTGSPFHSLFPSNMENSYNDIHSDSNT